MGRNGFQRLNSATWMNSHHIHMLTTYQPASRFDVFQWIEAAWLGPAIVVLIAAAVFLTMRRRA